MAKIFRLRTSPYAEDLTIPEIPDGGEGWLVTGPRSGDWADVHEGHSELMSFPNVKTGLRTRNLQSCTCIIYTAPDNRGAWLYHGKGGYLAKGFAMPWELPNGADLSPQDCLVAFSAWEDNDEWPGLIKRLEDNGIPEANIAACLRPRNNFETFAVNTSGQVGEPFGPMVKKKTAPLDMVGLITDQPKSASGGGGFFSCCRCYITTATSIALGLPDDNPTLRTLRWFRDEVLLKDPEGRADVELYYSLAPSIVHAIEARPDSREVYLRLYQRYLQPAVASIHARRFPTAHAIYREMVAELIERTRLPGVDRARSQRND